MPQDLDKMSLEELRTLRKDVDRAIQGYEKKKKKEALIAAQKAAEEHGFSLDEILSEKKSTTKRAPKYANPKDPSQTWTGRGRQPNWIKAAMKSGKSLEDMAI